MGAFNGDGNWYLVTGTAAASDTGGWDADVSWQRYQQELAEQAAKEADWAAELRACRRPDPATYLPMRLPEFSPKPGFKLSSLTSPGLGVLINDGGCMMLRPRPP